MTVYETRNLTQMSELDISEFSLPNGDQIGASMPLDNAGNQERIYLAGQAANEAAITTAILNRNGFIT